MHEYDAAPGTEVVLPAEAREISVLWRLYLEWLLLFPKNQEIIEQIRTEQEHEDKMSIAKS